ncbi:MAG: preprotein translocase subunit SecA, partial [Bacteroidia bacterium]|nr:preprotein translocase subunit SecA [Bacteroidia bacterium]
MLDFFTKSISKFFGTKSDRDLKEIQPIVEQILAEYPKLASLSNDQLRGKTAEFKKRIAEFSAAERKQVEEIRAKIDTDLSLDVESKESMYEQIDELEKTIIKKNEEALNDILPEAFAV